MAIGREWEVSKKVSFGPVAAPGVVGFVLVLILALSFWQPLRIWPFNTFIEEFALGGVVVALAGIMLMLRGRYWIGPLLWVWLAYGALLLLSAVLVPQQFSAPLAGYLAFWLVGLALTQLGAEFSWLRQGSAYSARLAIFLAAVAVVSVLLACVKHYQLWGELGRYLPAISGGRMNGVIGQANLFAVLCLLGLLALLWLLTERLLSVVPGLLLAGLVGYGLILSGSRVVGAIYLVVLAVAVLQAWRGRDWRYLLTLLLAGLGFWLLQAPVLQWDDWLRDRLFEVGLMTQNLDAEGAFSRGTGSLRFVEWPLAWQIFLAHLPFGIGPGHYAGLSYLAHLQQQVLPVEGLWRHSHNVYLQLWVEFGLPGVLWLCAMLALVARAIWRGIVRNRLMPVTVLLTLLIYGFFEFPFWYLHFFVLGLGVLAGGVEARPVEGKRLLGGVLALVAVAVLAFYASLFSALLNWHVQSKRGQVVEGVALKFVDRLVQDPLLGSYGMQFYYYYFKPGNLPIELELQELEKLYRHEPYAFFAGRYSVLLAVAGRRTEALKVRDDMVSAFPGHVPFFIEDVRQLGSQQPSWQLEFLLSGLPADEASTQ